MQTGKEPLSTEEFEKKKQVFQENFNLIQMQNNLYELGKSSWKMKVNEYTDCTIEEFENVRGIMMPDLPLHQNLKTSSKNLNRTFLRQAVPDEVNWVTKGAVSPVKDQVMIEMNFYETVSAILWGTIL